jgi:hypothetical protein
VFFSFNRQIELQRKVAAEIEAEGQRILALQAELAKNQPQQNQYQQGHQGQHSQQSNYNYNAQASNNVYQQQQSHSGYNSNAQPIGSAKPQQNYLPPQNYGKK